jgi:hypothetical protein
LIVEEVSTIKSNIAITQSTESAKEYKRSDVYVNKTGNLIGLFIAYTVHAVLSMIDPPLGIKSVDYCFGNRLLTSSS